MNPQPPVLETGALPVELRPCAGTSIAWSRAGAQRRPGAATDVATAGRGAREGASSVMSSQAQQDDALAILKDARTVAVVGLSPDPSRPSHVVASYLKRQGYRIIPVNPTVSEVLGERSYPDLRSVPEPVDVVDVFRRPEHVPAIVEEAIAIGAKAVWLQEGVVHEEAAQRARQAGLRVVMDRCMLKEHQRYRMAGRL